MHALLQPKNQKKRNVWMDKAIHHSIEWDVMQRNGTYDFQRNASPRYG